MRPCFPSLAVAVLLALALPAGAQTAPPPAAPPAAPPAGDRVAALEAQVQQQAAAIEQLRQQLAAMEQKLAQAARPAAPAAPPVDPALEEKASLAVSQINQLVAAGDMAGAKAKLTEGQAQFGTTQAWKSMTRLSQELAVIGRKLSFDPGDLEAVEVRGSQGPGNIVTIEIASANVTEVFTGFGERGVRAEAVAEGVVQEARRYLAAGVPVGPHLADQLLIPLALAGGGSFRTVAPTRHFTTNAEVIRLFTGARVKVTPLGGDAHLVEVERPGA